MSNQIYHIHQNYEHNIFIWGNYQMTISWACEVIPSAHNTNQQLDRNDEQSPKFVEGHVSKFNIHMVTGQTPDNLFGSVFDVINTPNLGTLL